MSQENVDVVRASWEAWERGDAQATLAIYDPAIEILDHDLPDAKENLPDAKESYRGFDGYIRWQADWEARWADWQWKPQEFIDAGDRVIGIAPAPTRRSGSRRALQSQVCVSAEEGNALLRSARRERSHPPAAPTLRATDSNVRPSSL